MKRPETTEYHPYFQHYIHLTDTGDFHEIFHKNTQLTADFFSTIPIEKHHYKYGPDKWTIKEVLMHIIDTERVFAYRTLVCLRGDNTTPLHSMDDNLYASNIDVTSRSMESLLEEFGIVRANSVFLFQNITEEQSLFLGNGVTHPFSARALGLIMMGHILHHINVIKERYL
ncbi:DinB family protein [Flavobacterium amniphilum]|uniref:DinB family protein n=1 Tax=Flavobacterium amniphilum TaxID=1834035 RepID=UPI002029E15C|nr:DinB family protein [Flavobacterium amniphilum]MCL9806887.1 DinB family protein [Flavobacterium amniphilum]